MKISILIRLILSIVLSLAISLLLPITEQNGMLVSKEMGEFIAWPIYTYIFVICLLLLTRSLLKETKLNLITVPKSNEFNKVPLTKEQKYMWVALGVELISIVLLSAFSNYSWNFIFFTPMFISIFWLNYLQTKSLKKTTEFITGIIFSLVATTIIAILKN